ncbi:MAG: hypothetical protein NTY76_08010 [Candidatus Omnitrophica bacterium]|nr:hypothetical protein [Candidatus Omnitrophota bacterium]
MKTLKIAVTIILAVAFVISAGFATFAEDYNDIVVRHQELTSKLMLNMRSPGIRTEGRTTTSYVPIKILAIAERYLKEILNPESFKLSQWSVKPGSLVVVFKLPDGSPATINVDMRTGKPSISGGDMVKNGVLKTRETIARKMNVDISEVHINGIGDWAIGMTMGIPPNIFDTVVLPASVEGYALKLQYRHNQFGQPVQETTTITLLSFVNKKTGTDLLQSAMGCLNGILNPNAYTLDSWLISAGGNLTFTFKLADGSKIRVNVSAQSGKSKIDGILASPKDLKQASTILGANAVIGITTLLTTKDGKDIVGAATITKFYDKEGNLVGSHVVNGSLGPLYGNGNRWLDGKGVLIGYDASSEALKQASTILGANATFGITIPPLASTPEGATTITKFYDKDGVLMGTHMVNSSLRTNSDVWRDGKGVIIGYGASPEALKQASTILGANAVIGITAPYTVNLLHIKDMPIYITTITKFYDKDGVLIGTHMVSPYPNGNRWLDGKGVLIGYDASSGALKQASTILGADATFGITIPPSSITNGNIEYVMVGAATVTKFYDKDGVLIGTHMVSGSLGPIYGNQWFNGQGVLIGYGASPEALKQASTILGANAAFGITTPYTIKIAGATITKFYDKEGNLIGTHMVSPYPNGNRWLDGKGVLIGYDASSGALKQASTILGANAMFGITIPPLASTPEGATTITKFYDKEGNLIGTHMVSPRPGGDQWFNGEGVLIGYEASEIIKTEPPVINADAAGKMSVLADINAKAAEVAAAGASIDPNLALKRNNLPAEQLKR